MNKRIKFLLMPFISLIVIATPLTLVNFNVKYKNATNLLLEKFTKSNQSLNNLSQKQNTTLISQNIENNTKNIDADLQKEEILFNKKKAPSLVSYSTYTSSSRSFPPTVSNYGFSGFWSSLSDVGKGLFITFLTGASGSVIGGLSYGIYKGIQKSKKDTQEQQLEEIKEEKQSGEGNYKLTFTITKNDQKNKNWSVYAFGGAGFEEETRKIGTFEEGKTDEKDKMQGGNGTFTFTFDKVKDPSKVTVILKTGNKGNEQTEPFKLGDYLDNKNSDKKLYFNDDYEWDKTKGELKKKENAQPLGEVKV